MRRHQPTPPEPPDPGSPVQYSGWQNHPDGYAQSDQPVYADLTRRQHPSGAAGANGPAGADRAAGPAPTDDQPGHTQRAARRLRPARSRSAARPGPERTGGPAGAAASARRSSQPAWSDDPTADQSAAALRRLERIERRKARSRIMTISIAVILIMLLTISLIILVMQRTRPKPQFLFIQKETLTHTIQGQALLIRQEVVFKAPSDGLLKPLATEGSRVGRNQKVALVIPNGQESKLQDLQKCEQDIIELQSELMNQGKGAGARAVYDESTAALSGIVNLIRGDMSRGVLSNLPAYGSSMNVILEQRSSKLLTIDFNDARLDKLRQTRTQLEKSLGLSAGTLVCEKPGIVSFKLDGLENDLQEKTIAKLTCDQYKTFLDKARDGAQLSEHVTKGQTVLRITASLYQYLAVFLPNVSEADFKPEANQVIAVPGDGTSIRNCTVERVESVNGGLFIIFRTDHKVEWFADRRTLAIELGLSATTGLKVPMASLIRFNEELASAQIMIVRGGKAELCDIRVRDHDREYAIVEPISPSVSNLVESSILVANPESIEAGEFIDE